MKNPDKKFDIRKTFEIFWTQPLSILTEGLFRLVNVQSNIFSQKSSVSVDFVNKKPQITVFNSEKLYRRFRSILFNNNF
jgi:hypothetical protein